MSYDSEYLVHLDALAPMHSLTAHLTEILQTFWMALKLFARI